MFSEPDNARLALLRLEAELEMPPGAMDYTLRAHLRQELRSMTPEALAGLTTSEKMRIAELTRRNAS